MTIDADQLRSGARQSEKLPHHPDVTAIVAFRPRLPCCVRAAAPQRRDRAPAWRARITRHARSLARTRRRARQTRTEARREGGAGVER